MKINAYKVICDAVENGIKYGWYKAHKHTDDPADDEIKHAIESAVLNEICEYFTFNEEGDQ